MPIHFSPGSHKWFVEGHIADHIFPKWDDITTFTRSKMGLTRSSRTSSALKKGDQRLKNEGYILQAKRNHPFSVFFIIGSFRYLLLHLHFLVNKTEKPDSDLLKSRNRETKKMYKKTWNISVIWAFFHVFWYHVCLQKLYGVTNKKEKIKPKRPRWSVPLEINNLKMISTLHVDMLIRLKQLW